MFLYLIVSRKFSEVSLNEYLRTHLQLTGTKVMCREGGCGACIVTAAFPDPSGSGQMLSRAINSVRNSSAKLLLIRSNVFWLFLVPLPGFVLRWLGDHHSGGPRRPEWTTPCSDNLGELLRYSVWILYTWNGHEYEQVSQFFDWKNLLRKCPSFAVAFAQACFPDYAVLRCFVTHLLNTIWWRIL